MVTLSILYKDKYLFKDFLKHKNFNFNKHCLIRIYTAICSPEEIMPIINDIKETIPNSSIIGGSCSGVVFSGEQFDTETLVIIEQFDNATIIVNRHSFKDKHPAHVAKEVNDAIEGFNVPLMHILCSDYYGDVTKFVDSFNSINQTTRLVGGVLGEILPKNIPPYAFTEEGVLEQSIVTASIIKKELHIFAEVNVAHEPISQVYTLNSCDGSNLLEINNTPAIDWCKSHFGMEDLKSYTDWQEIAENDSLLRFPLILQGHNSNNISRFIKYDSKSQNMSCYFSKLNENTQFKIGYVNPMKCVQEMYRICSSIKEQPIESLFFYSCLFRKLYLSNCAKWEISPFGKNICGIFLFGEIFYVNGKNEFLNGSCCFIGLAEQNSKNINIDFSVFDELYKIKDDNEQLLNIVLKKQSATIYEQNKKLLENVLLHQEFSKQRIYIDANLGINNSIKFLNEKHTKNFNKICMIQLENSDLLMSRLGKDEYFEIIKNVIHSLSKFIDNYSPYNNNYSIYALNDNTIFLAVGKTMHDDKFDKFINEIYKNFQFIKLPNREELIIFRFAIVIDEKNLIECGLETLQKCKSLQTYFLVYNSSNEKEIQFDNEMEIIQLLNEVIKNNWVIPYFQGMYDNKNKVINKYEALMRIRDKNGKIYSPYYFMDIAKKYNLYPTLSRMMVEQVLDIFDNLQTNVSINFSAYDINSKSFQNAIFKKLENIKNKGNFTFEILEDENFRSMEMLKIFIKRAREHNVKIAIDDFGTGYSNFMEISKIAPDFIKVDGAIIKNIDSDIMNFKVLKTIVYLGKQLNATLIAEFVENESIQKVIEHLDIQFSQGYYFSKPEPYENIKDNLK
ncbi:EAL domain-containing protein [uncultured Tyzzerella sp.]|uniref:bifunctional diguanylate cyclase/phosphodiesterase n=1 Tax=uncultured Tyzzerella sp. TaxID=2321398 RepID=UPI0029435E83|nr:EAL domain-containing protein [uncultured Tyzzerella sp.]